MPVAASAAVKLNIEDKTGLLPGAGMQFVDVVFEATGENATVNEQLGLFDIGLRLVKRGGGALSGVSFAPPYLAKPTNAEGFIFPDTADFTVIPEDSGADRAFANVDANTAGNYDIVTGKKLARIYFTVDQIADPLAVYEIRINPGLTVITAGAGDDPNIVADFSDVGVISFIPEPGSLSLLAIGGLLALRRRRTA
jgi:hypothetical protein